MTDISSKKNSKKTCSGSTTGHSIRRSPRLNGEVTASSAIIAAKKNAYKLHSQKNKADTFVRDVYQIAQDAKDAVLKPTGLVYDRRMIEHRCLWDENYQECPERFTCVLQRCEQLGLISRCYDLGCREATLDEILTLHTQEHIDILRATENSHDVDALEELSSRYDAIYIHPTTYRLALLAAGSAIQLVDEVCRGTVQNGMAIIRPPGHHAMKSEYCGYCYFNNVALAAHHALTKLNLSRILIVDWDVHHGQATQQMFYNDPRVVYFSIHRYEYGTFWPNLRESEFDYIGENHGKGYNFNIPLNHIGMTNADYMAIFHHVLLPMATEFQPELIIVSAGYDSAVGCPEGEMNVTPACYPHLLSSLMGLANGKVAVILEGGYCLKSLAEGAALTLRALLGDPCPNIDPLPTPCVSIQETILNCISSHRPYWQCYQFQGKFNASERQLDNPKQHWPVARYLHSYTKNTIQPQIRYQTRDCYPMQSQERINSITQTLNFLISVTKLLSPQYKVCMVYDPVMMEHENLNDQSHPEKPARISGIYDRHCEYGLVDRIHVLKSREATLDELQLVHELKHISYMQEVSSQTDLSEEGRIKSEKIIKKLYNSVYIHPQSYKCASLAAGCVLQVVDSVLKGESGRGVAIVRPPGHHAEPYEPCGFCIFNNVSIAAKYAIKNYGLKRILLVDWDVHHGNGTQRIFESDNRVLYISVHRYDKGNFFPGSKDAAATVVGSGDGVGFNVNIPWNQRGMGNAEYMAAFQQVVLPIAYQYCPELVLISAGFDAAVGDPLGGCKVTPEAYAHLTQWLSPLAMGRVILCLEGGYNLTSISYAMTLCTKTLLGDPVPSLDPNMVPRPAAVADLKAVLEVQSKYWSAICFNKDLPDGDVLTDPEKYGNFQDVWTNGVHVELNSTGDLVGPKESNLQTDTVLVEECLSKLSLNDSDDKPNGGSTNSSQQESNLQSVSEATGDSASSSVPSTSQQSGTQKPATDDMTQSLLLLETGQCFAVVPLRSCPHLGDVRPVPPQGVDTRAPCLGCESTQENWTCLTCYTVHCSRYVNEHMEMHANENAHPLALSFSDLSVWCYACEAYIDNQVLSEAKNAAHLSKFGEPILLRQ